LRAVAQRAEAVGFDSLPASITEVAPAALTHFGVEPPAYARPLARVD